MKSAAFDRALQTVTRIFRERLPNPDFESYYTEMLDTSSTSTVLSADDAVQDYEAMLHAQLMAFSGKH